mmetsp:Transcript_58492/g.174198  ORF Transcript_58492/g.174198 Transcript_58492/m.174198 type:complete len:186 (-) Transcript_58492:138-695(-)
MRASDRDDLLGIVLPPRSFITAVVASAFAHPIIAASAIKEKSVVREVVIGKIFMGPTADLTQTALATNPPALSELVRHVNDDRPSKSDPPTEDLLPLLATASLLSPSLGCASVVPNHSYYFAPPLVDLPSRFLRHTLICSELFSKMFNTLLLPSPLSVPSTPWTPAGYNVQRTSPPSGSSPEPFP